MNIIKTVFEDALILEPDVHKDSRGFFTESYNDRHLKKLGIPCDFVQDNHSLSLEAGILRGLHFQSNPKAQSKLVRVTQGAICDVIVDLRKDSPTYKKYESFILSSYNFRQLYVPKGFAHGFCTLVPNTEVQYKVDQYYSPEHDAGIYWNDPELGILWPVSNPKLSDKDLLLPAIAELEESIHLGGS